MHRCGAAAATEARTLPVQWAHARHYRIEVFHVEVDDLAIELLYSMPDSNEPQRFSLNTLETQGGMAMASIHSAWILTWGCRDFHTVALGNDYQRDLLVQGSELPQP